MVPPIFKVISSNAAVVALLKQGAGDVRFYPSGRAPQNVKLPYVVWQIFAGPPNNYLGDRPDGDTFDIQVDVYGETVSQTRTVAAAIRDAIETQCYITSWRGDDTDPSTNKPIFSFDLSWIVYR